MTDGRSYYTYLLLKHLPAFNIECLLLTDSDSDTTIPDSLNIKIFKSDISSKNPFAIFRNVNLINKIQSDFSIDIIHNFHRFTELITLLAQSKNKNFKSAMTVLSIVNKKYFLEYRSDALICVSKGLRNILLNEYKRPDKNVTVIHPFVSTDEIRISDKTQSENFTIYADGRFHFEKDFITLLKAINQLKDCSIKLILVGTGEEEANLKSFAEENNLNVEFIKPKYDRSEFFNQADLCVLPSVRDPFPLFMLLAGAYKKPFIGANTDGIAELIVDGINGFLFEKQNYIELAEKINFIKNNKQVAVSLSENLNNDVSSSYTEKKSIPAIINIYKNLTNNKN